MNLYSTKTPLFFLSVPLWPSIWHSQGSCQSHDSHHGFRIGQTPSQSQCSGAITGKTSRSFINHTCYGKGNREFYIGNISLVICNKFLNLFSDLNIYLYEQLIPFPGLWHSIQSNPLWPSGRKPWSCQNDSLPFIRECWIHHRSNLANRWSILPDFVWASKLVCQHIFCSCININK